MARAVGIDLGTTNSAIAVLEGGEPTIIPNAEGGRTTPSVVAFSKSGEVLVGEIAKRQAVTNVDRTISSVKRHMGTDWSVDIDGKKYTAQEISARILAKLKADAESYLGEPVTNAVITVPAYCKDGVDLSKDKIAMQRLKDAAEQAKKELSSATSTNINLQYLSMSESGPIHPAPSVRSSGTWAPTGPSRSTTRNTPLRRSAPAC